MQLRSVIEEMAQFNNDIPLTPQTKDEQIEQMQKVINYLSRKIDELENKVKEQNNGNKGTED